MINCLVFISNTNFLNEAEPNKNLLINQQSKFITYTRKKNTLLGVK